MKESNENLLSNDNMQPLDSLYLPKYVESDPIMKSNFLKYGFFPWIDKNNIPRAYVADTSNNGFEIISDFYVEPLLHIVDGEINLRIVKINHLYPSFDKKQIFPSYNLTNLTTFQTWMLNAGPYNFSGSRSHFEKIKLQMSYDFKTCTSLLDLIDSIIL